MSEEKTAKFSPSIFWQHQQQKVTQNLVSNGTNPNCMVSAWELEEPCTRFPPGETIMLLTASVDWFPDLVGSGDSERVVYWQGTEEGEEVAPPATPLAGECLEAMSPSSPSWLSSSTSSSSSSSSSDEVSLASALLLYTFLVRTGEGEDLTGCLLTLPSFCWARAAGGKLLNRRGISATHSCASFPLPSSLLSSSNDSWLLLVLLLLLLNCKITSVELRRLWRSSDGMEQPPTAPPPPTERRATVAVALWLRE
jgi:hypothetical protein